MARNLLRTSLAAAAAAAALTGGAQAAGGNYVFDGGTARQQSTVRAALAASQFDFGIIPARITVHIGRVGVSHAGPGEVWLDGALLDASSFAWATVQDEFAHQVDFFLLDAAKRDRLTRKLGGRDWCYGTPGYKHGEYTCERFASTLVWAYWQSADNAYRPTSRGDESAAMAPAKFRALMTKLLGVPPLALRAAAKP